MNNNLMFSSKSEMWETPQAFFDDLNNIFQFTLDACATPENAKCERYFTPEMDGLKQDWDGVVWCNPPKEDGTYIVQTNTGAITTARFYAFKSFPATKYFPAVHRHESWQSNRNVVKWTFLPQPPKGEFK